MNEIGFGYAIDIVLCIDDMIKLFDTYGLKYLGCNCY